MSPRAVLSWIAMALVAIYMGNKLYEVPVISKTKIPSYVYWLATGMLIILASERKSLLFGYIIYVFLLFVVYDVVAMIMRKIRPTWYTRMKRVYMHGFLVLCISLVITAYGYYNSSHTVITDYHVTIDKKMLRADPMRILMISDTHVGTAIGKQELAQLVERINARKPDMVCLAGDIIDENTPESMYEYVYDTLGKIQSAYGTYYVCGNHELYTKQGYQKIAEGFRKRGITPLLDETYLVADSFYLIGRLDYDLVREGGTRKSLSYLMRGVDHSYPVILLDHQPIQYEEAKKEGVDLVMSGHTHNGQLYPGNYLILLGNEVGYGYRENGSLKEVVSSGAGTWGFAMRVGSSSEIVELIVEGNEAKLAQE